MAAAVLTDADAVAVKQEVADGEGNSDAVTPEATEAAHGGPSAYQTAPLPVAAPLPPYDDAAAASYVTAPSYDPAEMVYDCLLLHI